MSEVVSLKGPSFDEIPAGRAAMWWVIASEVVIFGGLVACYLLYRFRFSDWVEMSQHTSTILGAANTLILLTSSLFAVLAHDFAVKKDTKRTVRYINLTLLCGFMFLGIKGVEYAHEIHQGYTISSPLFWSFYYLMTGLHGLHVIAGMVALFTVSLGVRKGRNLHRVELAGLYWHLVDVVWIFLFPLLYIAK